MKKILLVFCCVLVLIACDNPDRSELQASFCQQATHLMDIADEGPITPRNWGSMMLAGARLIYVTQECGTRVTETPEELCVTLYDAMQVFSTSSLTPVGENRDTAINQSSKVYRGSGCQPPLGID